MELDQLEKDFLTAIERAMTDFYKGGHEEKTESVFVAKAAASLCREKCKEAIENFTKTFPEKDLQSSQPFNPKDHDPH